MEIKQFKVIPSKQKKELYNFIKSTDLTYNKTYIEMMKIYESDTFNEGSTVFIVFYKGEIKGSVALITKEISIKGEAFITDIYVERENISKQDAYSNSTLKVLNTKIILEHLIERAVEYCNMCNARSIKIGIRKSEKQLIQYINNLGFDHIYDAVVMRYKEDKNMVMKTNNDIELKPLCILNAHEYMDIHNDAFKNSPNGGTIDEVEVKDYIVQNANNEDLIGICFAQKKPCGIYELSIDGDTGWVDILAIAPVYQNSGLGKSLLVKCIKKLYEQNLDEVKLLVITSNNIAVNMYKASGFEMEKVFSYWFEKKL
ncbi:MAG TPA: GNAT family N-acetyltransferase [Candidatus Paceibacterota bacterium]